MAVVSARPPDSSQHLVPRLGLRPVRCRDRQAPGPIPCDQEELDREMGDEYNAIVINEFPYKMIFEL